MFKLLSFTRVAAAAVALVGIGLSVQPAASQQMGRDGYSFPARSSSLAAQFDFQRRQASTAANASSGGGGIGALQQYITTYSSTSTSVGNMNTVNQTLAAGATGSVSTNADQASTGNQGSDAATDTTVDNSLTNSGTISEILGPITPPAN